MKLLTLIFVLFRVYFHLSTTLITFILIVLIGCDRIDLGGYFFLLLAIFLSIGIENSNTCHIQKLKKCIKSLLKTGK